MLEPKARWVISEQVDEEFVELLTSELGMDPLIAQLLSVRGIQSIQDAKSFMQSDVNSFYDPFLLKGMQRAVERIRMAINNQEKIRIYGDYDADGVSSTALMIYVLRQLHAKFDYYIPHRANEGYGLNVHSIDHAKKNGVSLMVTVDNGISANEQIQYATELGMDTIVTDHHEPPNHLPDAYAIINPKQPECNYPFKELAGVGVAFKLAHALLGRVPMEFTQIAAIGTVADLMPLIDENRLIVKLGLEQIHNNPFIGVKALCGVSKIDYKEITATHIGFALAPRINASGRLDSAKEATQLLITSNEQEAEHLAYRLDQLNKERQSIVDEIKLEVIKMLEQSKQTEFDSVLVVAGENWNVGVIGIVASKILDLYFKPVIILTIDPESGLAKGSARSIAGFDIYKALTECNDLLINYGGHQAAAGMTLHRDHISQFREKLNMLASAWLREEDFVPIQYADMECSIQELPLECIERIQWMAPFGQGNPTPRFIFNQLRIHDMKTIGKDRQHLKLMVSQTMDSISYTIEAIAFGQGEIIHSISPTAKIDLLGEVSINEWNGLRRPQLLVRDLRITDRQVFDWRGLTMTDMASRLSAMEREPAIVIFPEHKHSDTIQEVGSLNYSVWTLNTNGQIVGLNEHAKSKPFPLWKDVVLYSLPPQLSMLESILESCTTVERIYVMFGQDDHVFHRLPTRQAFKKMYSVLQHQREWPAYDQRVLQHLSTKTGMSKDMIQFIMAVFEELSFIERDGTSYRCVVAPQKKDLTTSLLYQQRMHVHQVEETLLYSSTQELTEWILKRLFKLNTSET